MKSKHQYSQGQRRSRPYQREGQTLPYCLPKFLGSLFAIAGIAFLYAGEASTLFASVKAPSPVQSSSNIIIGRASVIDGDTIEIHGKRIRFDGIDAPEATQHCRDQNNRSVRCGAHSAEALATFLRQSQPARCSITGLDRYGRLIGSCSRHDGLGVSEWMVRNGHALDWPQHSDGRYQTYQKAARSERKGLWSGSFDEPWAWRKQRADTDLAATQRTPEANPGLESLGLVQNTIGSCRIKGNISAEGARIYHVPGQKYYARTKIDKSAGERWFCSESEARSAGWRRSKV